MMNDQTDHVKCETGIFLHGGRNGPVALVARAPHRNLPSTKTDLKVDVEEVAKDEVDEVDEGEAEVDLTDLENVNLSAILAVIKRNISL